MLISGVQPAVGHEYASGGGAALMGSQEKDAAGGAGHDAGLVVHLSLGMHPFG